MTSNTIFLLSFGTTAAIFGWRLWQARQRGGLFPGMLSTWAAAAAGLTVFALLYLCFIR